MKILFLRADQYSSTLFSSEEELSFHTQLFSKISFDQTASIETNSLPIFQKMHQHLITSHFIFALDISLLEKITLYQGTPY